MHHLMERYQLILAYDGTHFKGFQRQAQARTVQSVFEEALARLGWPGGPLLAAGRTDTGVHASGQVVAFDLEWPHPPQALLQALNANLPPDVAGQSVRLAAPDFHPRHQALSREYHYRLLFRPARSPLEERYAWRFWPPLDLAPLTGAAQALAGTHDFAAFGTPTRPGGNTRRTVYRAAWQQAGPEVRFEIEGNAFLYHMVRRLVRLQVEIARGKYPPTYLAAALENPASCPVRGLAPPQGLCLTRVRYPVSPDSNSSLPG